MKKSGFLLGTVVAAAAGIVAGVLTAPKSGKETRADLRATAQDLRDGAEDKAKDTFEKARDQFKNDKQ